MHTIDFFFDPISPYAWLAFQQLPKALMGCSYEVRYRPVLFGAILKHHGHLGPAEIPFKRDWTYRQVMWLAHSLGQPLRMPAAHPFNPLALARLALACATPEAPQACNRLVTETVFRHVWTTGEDPLAPERLVALRTTLADHMQARGGALADPDGDAVKQALRANGDEALAAGVFGVPSLVVDGRVFWGLDSLPMLKAYLEGDTWFQTGDWEAAAACPVGIRRAQTPA